MKQPTIDKEFKSLIDPLTAEELDQLERSICARGIREPLVVWKQENILVDGHNRFNYAQGTDIEIPYVYYTFTDRDDVKNFIIRNQLGRRNVDPDTAAKLRGMLYEVRKQAVKNPEGIGGKSGKIVSNQNDDKQKEKTCQVIAKETGVSQATIQRDAKFAAALAKQGMTVADFKATGKTRKQFADEVSPPKPRKQKAKVVKQESNQELPVNTQAAKQESTLFETWITQIPKLTKEEWQSAFVILHERWGCQLP